MTKHPFLLIFGVVLPVITLVAEFVSGMCAQVYVNPMPTLWHVLMIGLVPAANLYTVSGLAKTDRLSFRPFFWANGIALGISSIYAMAFVPIAPFSIIAVLFWGFGFLPLSPIIAFFAAVAIGAKLHRIAFDGENQTASRHVRSTVLAVFLGWGLFLCGDLPFLITRESVALAVSQNESRQKKGLWLLRTLGSESELLRLSRDEERDIRPSSWAYRPVSELDVRHVFYQATGRAIDQQPLGRLASRRRNFFWNNDADLGGESVSGYRSGLYLDVSEMEVRVDPTDLLAYNEWTMEFQNINPWAEEARTQIRLPAGSVVSRLTLWVNGVPREAAFAATEKVRAAYQQVAVVQRCDPVLVTWKGPDRIFMQCFPVPAEGRLKLRFGVTSPLDVDGETPSVRLPHLSEQNFSCSRRMQHSVRAWSTDESLLTDSIQQDSTPASEVHWNINDRRLTNAKIQLAESSDLASLSTAATDQDVAQSFSAKSDAPLDRLCIVLDGSVHIKPHFETLAKAVHHINRNVEVRLLIAADETYDLTELIARRDEKGFARTLSRELRRRAGKGGMDNVPTLAAALKRHRFSDRSAVVWLHGPQPIELSSRDAVWSLLAETPELRAYDVQIGIGPNRVTEEFSANGFRQILLTDVEQELPPLFERMINGRTYWQRRLERTEAQADAESDSRLIDLWARDEVDRLLSDDYERNRDKAIEIAAAHHIVSPVTGAVVLETDQQFADADLTPVDAAKAINTPEPSSATLGLLALLSLLAYARRRRLV